MFTSKFYVDTKRNNALMVRIINNRKKVELSMGFQMDEETLANAMSDKPKPKNLRYKSLLSHWQAIIEDLKIDLVRQHKSDMDVKEILSHVDHTLLLQTATWEEIKQICDDAVEYQTASICIPPSYVKQAYEYLQGKVDVCTVIGFPNGYMTTKAKEFETKDAIADGASEIDMVINIGWLKDRRYAEIKEEICRMHEACGGKILKVIIETCLLTEEEKKKMCEIVTEAGAEFIKTSTGFSSAGATFSDIALMREYTGSKVKIKAAGGISSFEDAEEFLRLGADRLGTSRLVKLMQQQNTTA